MSTVLVTGATGYIGGRLVPRLLERGHQVRCLTRNRSKLEARGWLADSPDSIEIVEGDGADPEAVTAAMAGCDAAYYLIHSMIVAGADYRAHDKTLAEVFAACAERAALDQIVYLGGLGETAANLSEHLASRREVERALAAGPVPVTVLRAAMIIGSGSASFEILRYLVERLPVMITPRWVSTECQPIAVRDVLRYLVEAIETPATLGETIDVGGADVLSYAELMQITAAALGLPKRLILPVPVLTPRLSSLWIHLVTPLDRRIARPLAEGLKNRVVCRDDRARQLMPFTPIAAQQAIELALGRLRAAEVSTSWSDAGTVPGDPDWAGGTCFVDRRELQIAAAPDATWLAVCRIGGGNGWYAADILWRIRGLIDRLVGGPGLRRGRRDPTETRYGDALDFWRVTAVEKARHLELRAEMKLPGEALLEFELTPHDGGTRLVQTARFKPRGLFGLAYWYAVFPFHGVVFAGMLRGIERQATTSSLP